MPTDEQRKVWALEYEVGHNAYEVARVFNNEKAARKALKRELKTAGSRLWTVVEYEVEDAD